MSEYFKLSFKIEKKKLFRNLVLAITICSLFFTAFYLHFTEPDLKLSEIVKIITGGFVVVGLIYSVMTYELNQRKNSHDTFILSKKSIALLFPKCL